MIQVIRAKLHGLRVTDANLDYQGSITLDPDHCARVGIYPLEFVDVWNKSNGQRLQTYVILGEPGSRCCILNGSAARACQPGDEIIVAAREYVERSALYNLKPKILMFGDGNKIDQEFHYDVFASPERKYDFRIMNDDNTADLQSGGKTKPERS